MPKLYSPVGDTHGELAQIFSKAKDKLKFNYLYDYDKEENTHNFAGAIRHYVVGHEHCSYVTTLLPHEIHQRLQMLEGNFHVLFGNAIR